MSKGEKMAAEFRAMRERLRRGEAKQLEAESATKLEAESAKQPSLFAPRPITCTREKPNPNARWHDGMHEVGKTSHADGRYTRYRCDDCGVEWETAE